MSTSQPSPAAPDEISFETLLRVVTGRAGIAVIVVDLERICRYANPIVNTMFGLQPRELAGDPVSASLPGVYESHLRAQLDRAFAGTEVSYEFHTARPGGADQQLSVIMEPIQHGTRVAMVVVVITDITDRKRVEEALREERDRAQRYLDTADVILLALDTAGKVTLINRKGCDVLGWTEAELLGQDWFAMCLPREVQQEELKKFDALLGGDLSPDVSPVVTKSGDERLIDWRNTVLRDDDGNVVGSFSSGADVTERRQLEDQYHQAQRLEVVGRLAGGVAHDFNNLLTAILVTCQLLLDEVGSNSALHQDLIEIQTAGESAARLTRQLLAFSRKAIIEPSTLDLNAIVSNVKGILGRLIGEDIRIHLDLANDLGSITADAAQVEQIIINLAVNARDAMPRGGTLTVATENVSLDENTRPGLSLPAGPYVTLTVTDTGTGMTPDVLSHLFEPFFTTKGAGHGTGLGLATVHGIMTLLGGAVTCSSEVGVGTSFTLAFPRTANEVPTRRPGSMALRGTGETILVVEDADGLRELTKRLLEREGYRVLLAPDGEEALRLFEQMKVDLVLTDVVMPGLSGQELTKQLTELLPGVKVIYMSGYSDDAISHHGILAPGIAFLQKPFTTHGLLRKVREVLDG